MKTITKHRPLRIETFEELKNPENAQRTRELEMEVLKMRLPSQKYIDNELTDLVVKSAIKGESQWVQAGRAAELIDDLETIASYQNGKYSIRPRINKDWGLRWHNQNIRRMPIVSPFKPNFDEEKLAKGDIKILRFKMFGDNNDTVPLPSCVTTPIDPVVYHMDADVTIAYDKTFGREGTEILAFDLGYKFYCTYTTLGGGRFCCSLDRKLVDIETVRESLYMSKITRNTSFLGMQDEIDNVLTYLGKERFSGDEGAVGLARCKHTIARAMRVEYAMRLITAGAHKFAEVIRMEQTEDARHEIFKAGAIANAMRFVFSRNNPSEVKTLGDGDSCVDRENFYHCFAPATEENEEDFDEPGSEQD